MNRLSTHKTQIKTTTSKTKKPARIPAQNVATFFVVVIYKFFLPVCNDVSQLHPEKGQEQRPVWKPSGFRRRSSYHRYVKVNNFSAKSLALNSSSGFENYCSVKKKDMTKMIVCCCIFVHPDFLSFDQLTWWQWQFKPKYLWGQTYRWDTAISSFYRVVYFNLLVKQSSVVWLSI